MVVRHWPELNWLDLGGAVGPSNLLLSHAAVLPFRLGVATETLYLQLGRTRIASSVPLGRTARAVPDGTKLPSPADRPTGWRRSIHLQLLLASRHTDARRRHTHTDESRGG